MTIWWEMDKQKPENLAALLLEKDKTIVALNDLIKKSADEFQSTIQSKINYYENILAHMPGHVYWLDRNNVYLGCNDIQAKKVLLNSRHDIVGKVTLDLLKNEEQALENDRLNNQIMETGIAYTGIECTTMSDGDGIYFSQKVPLRNELNEVIGLLGISIDITELKKTESALTVAKNLAEAANRAKVEFIANMSHDIRTPISGVVGMSQLLMDNLTHPEHKQFALWINQSGEQLLALLSSILDVVSAENVNESDINNETFDLRQCIDELVQLERPTTVLKNIELNVEIDERAPRYIVTDRVKLHRVLLNLLGNAIKFTEAGFITIDVKLVDFNGEQTYLQFQVIDTGIGISLDHQNQVFDRFFKANSSYAGVYSGHGVGLHIAQSYVKLLGGELNFTSQPGMGTTFYFDLPIIVPKVEETLDEFNLADKSSIPIDMSNCDVDVPHVLLVEDNAIALRMLELIVTQSGCHYTSTLNGEDALALFKETRFDLVITDIGLPSISGYKLTQCIRQWETELDKTPIPIIGLTAHAHAKDKCLQSGMNDVFCKPLNRHIMKSILSEFISFNIDHSVASVKREHGLPDDSKLFNLEQFPLLDLQHAEERIGNKAVLFDMLHLMATQEIPNDELILQSAHAILDWDAIEKLVHKMKGGAVYCGTFKMQYACQYLERYRKAGRTALLEQLYQQLLSVLGETRDAILQL